MQYNKLETWTLYNEHLQLSSRTRISIFWSELLSYFHMLCMRSAKILGKLYASADCSDPWLIIDAINTSIFIMCWLLFSFRKGPRKSKQISRARENPRVADFGDEPAGQNLNLDGECQYCFMRPCITARNLQIVGSGQSACEDNSGIRKGIYKLYWKV